MSPKIELEHSRIDELEEILKNKGAGKNEKVTAMEDLGEMGASKSIPELRRIIEKSSDQELVSAAARALGEINSLDSIDFLNDKMLASSSKGKRIVISGALKHGFSNPVEPDERIDSIEELDDKEKKVKELEKMKEIRAPETAERMIDYLKSDEKKVRKKSREVIKELGHRSILPLKEAAEEELKEEDEEERREEEEDEGEALELLRELGPELGYKVKKKESFFENLKKYFK